ncbi:MAG: hypothetical protein ACKVKR_16880, partial [Pseudomonadales bacterium]
EKWSASLRFIILCQTGAFQHYRSPLNTVVVHGHEQCAICKSNIFECCSGDTCYTDYNLSVGYKRG